MKYHELDVKSSPQTKRVGRGIAGGRGKTAGRGTKGQKSRAGYARRMGFEGGQTSLIQKIPKLRGFKSHQSKPEVVTVGQLASIKATTIDTTVLADNGLISNRYVRVKLVAGGELSKKLNVKLYAASVGAQKALETRGGVFVATDQLSRPKQSKQHSEKSSTSGAKEQK